MRIPGFRSALLAVTAGVGLSGCAYDMYGDPYGYGYGYGPYSSVSVGVGYGGYGGYGYGYPYGGYGYYGGYDPFGWYGDYYYPGTGIYVYDRSHHRHEWNDQQRRYWQDRHARWQSHGGTTTSTSENWSGWDRSHWRGRNNSATVTNSATANSAPSTTTTTSNYSGRATRGNWQGTSSSTWRRGDSQRGEGGHRSAERADEKPQ